MQRASLLRAAWERGFTFYAIVLLVFIVLGVISLTGYSVEKVVFPLVAIALGIIACGLKIVAISVPSLARALDPAGMLEMTTESSKPSKPEPQRSEQSGGNVKSLVLWLASGSAFLYLLGFNAGCGIIALWYVKFIERQSWFKALATAVALPLALFVLFVVALKQRPYAGYLVVLLKEYLGV
ncbi:MAG TPA: hypothetical protein GX507_06630 [Clostridia bacterium]|nr:hypothetical protein [Clostridia bacterium]